jgi:uracil-DNA glycosylase
MDTIASLREECMKCRKCSIAGQYLSGNLAMVFSNMNPSNVMVVGQNPGATEVAQGMPFVGPSGKFFDECIQEVLGITRDDLYISNVVRCYTTGNRGVTSEEIENCRGFLDREIAVVRPKLIIALGGFALKQLTGMSRISAHRGEIIVSPRYGVRVLPLLHPSPLNMNRPANKEQFKKDLLAAKPYIHA